MRPRLVLAACTALGGCASSRGDPAPQESIVPRSALYEFSAATPNQVIRGRIRVDGDAMGVEFETPCQSEATLRGRRPNGMPSTSFAASHYCSGAWLTFNRQNPANAKWFATLELPRTRQVCARYETRNGRRVCVSQSTETYNEIQTRSGGITVRRIR